jgi:hypothetical protein
MKWEKTEKRRRWGGSCHECNYNGKTRLRIRIEIDAQEQANDADLLTLPD